MSITRISALLQLSSRPDAAAGESIALLADVHRQISNLLRDLPAAGAPEVARLGLIQALRQTAEGELADAFEAICWEIEPAAECRAMEMPALTAEAAYYAAREAMRNAARHGRSRAGQRRSGRRPGAAQHNDGRGGRFPHR